jgi:hypothetical protein
MMAPVVNLPWGTVVRFRLAESRNIVRAERPGAPYDLRVEPEEVAGTAVAVPPQPGPCGFVLYVELLHRRFTAHVRFFSEGSGVVQSPEDRAVTPRRTRYSKNPSSLCIRVRNSTGAMRRALMPRSRPSR